MACSNFFLSHIARMMTIAASMAVIGASVAMAQDTSKPLDLTVLSTNQDNVSFVVEQSSSSDNNSAATQSATSQLADNQSSDNQLADNQSEALSEARDNLPDNASELTASDVIASESTDTESTDLGQSQTTGRMTRRTLKDVGLASIGIGNGGADSLDALDNRLWRGVPLARAMRLIDAVPVPVSSDALRKMSYQVIARQAVPPKGAAENPASLLGARMDYLSRVGRSDGLAAIIAQLPDDENWQDWHIWKLFYDLMLREDEQACATAAENATTSLDPLWQKTNLMCQILTGDEVRAAFSADVLKASGLIDDPLYFDLVDVLLRRRGADSISAEMRDSATLDVMHLILMDAAHVTMRAADLSAMGQSYAQAANSLRYLQDDARHSLGMNNLRAGLISQIDAKALFIASTQAADTPLMAMARRLEAGAQDKDAASVSLYLALSNAATQAQTLDHDQAEELAMLTLSAVASEVKAGEGAIWVPFYAPILAQVMGGVDMPKLAPSTQQDYATLSALAGQMLSPLPTDGSAVVRADHIAIIQDDAAAPAARLQSLQALGLSHLMPLIAGQEGVVEDWFTIFDVSAEAGAVSEQNKAYQKQAYIPLSQTGLRALGQAAVKGQRAEAVIIASMLIGDTKLSHLSPSDHAAIADALAVAGLPNTAVALRQEALRAHLMMALLAAMGDEAS